MRSRLFPVLLLSCVLLACCCKVYCPRQAMDLAFAGFSREELDTISIRKFEAGGFATLLDSMFIRIGGFTGDTLDFLYIDADGFDRRKNYEVFLPGVDRTFRISGIQTRKHDCGCGQRDGHRVSAYNLDGTLVMNETVLMRK